MDQWLIESVLNLHPKIDKAIGEQWNRREPEFYIDWVQMENMLREVISEVENNNTSPTDAIVLFREIVRTYTRREFTDDNDDKTTG